MDDLLNVSNQKYHIILDAPRWLFEAKRKKWSNHVVIHKDEIKLNTLDFHEHELFIYAPKKRVLSRHVNALSILECIDKGIFKEIN
ncbi:hypothetical protein [Bacillus sp. SM2101]|uniref:hypothetical protein n=1 Tax=Bacillus sp. SM2101 TaxID=2805366 RepID=UPI001BDF490A|nr:hypothetical protein [Bacillus sp. SM2101]